MDYVQQSASCLNCYYLHLLALMLISPDRRAGAAMFPLESGSQKKNWCGRQLASLFRYGQRQVEKSRIYEAILLIPVLVESPNLVHSASPRSFAALLLTNLQTTQSYVHTHKPWIWPQRFRAPRDWSSCYLNPLHQVFLQHGLCWPKPLLQIAREHTRLTTGWPQQLWRHHLRCDRNDKPICPELGWLLQVLSLLKTSVLLQNAWVTGQVPGMDIQTWLCTWVILENPTR